MWWRGTFIVDKKERTQPEAETPVAVQSAQDSEPCEERGQGEGNSIWEGNQSVQGGQEKAFEEGQPSPPAGELGAG